MISWKDDNNKRALAIIRRSSYGQKDNTSADTQEEGIREYAARNDLQLIKVEAIIETAYVAEERKKYKTLMEFALKQGIKHVLFFLGSREARNCTDTELNEGLIKADRIVVHHVNEGRVFWKGSPDSDFMSRDVLTAVNKHYSRELGSTVRRGCHRKAVEGWWPFRHTPLAYIHHKEKDPIGNAIKGTATIIVDPKIQNVTLVQREFELRSKGYSILEIRKMNLEGGFVPALIGKKKYSRTSIGKRLMNPFYWGQFQLTGDPKVYHGKHPLIIPQSTLDAVKAINEGRAFKKNPNTNGADLFKGWLVCAHPECQRQIMYDGKTKTIKETGQKKTFHYYTCSNSRRIHSSKKYISEEKIWAQFEPAVDSLALSEDFAKDIADALNETHEKQKQAIRMQMEGFRKALRELEGKEDQFYQHLSNGVLNEAGYKRQIERVRLEREDYTRQIENLNLSISDEGMISAKKVLELAINAKSLWKSMERPQRLEYLKKVCSNQTLDGLTVRYELQKPFARLAAWKESDEWRRVRDSKSSARPSAEGLRLTTLAALPFGPSASLFAIARAARSSSLLTFQHNTKPQTSLRSVWVFVLWRREVAEFRIDCSAWAA